jgi:regulatory protein
VPRKSRGSAADRPVSAPADPYGLALGWLGARELSAAQVRQRLLRRHVEPAIAESVVTRLLANGALDDARVAASAARRETTVKGRGPTRVAAKLRSLGLSDTTASAALTEALAQVDVGTLLDRALEKRLHRLPAGPLDPAATRKIVGALVRQGFAPAMVFARLRRRAADVPDDIE